MGLKPVPSQPGVSQFFPLGTPLLPPSTTHEKTAISPFIPWTRLFADIVTPFHSKSLPWHVAGNMSDGSFWRGNRIIYTANLYFPPLPPPRSFSNFPIEKEDPETAGFTSKPVVAAAPEVLARPRPGIPPGVLSCERHPILPSLTRLFSLLKNIFPFLPLLQPFSPSEQNPPHKMGSFSPPSLSPLGPKFCPFVLEYQYGTSFPPKLHRFPLRSVMWPFFQCVRASFPFQSFKRSPSSRCTNSLEFVV